MIGGLLVDLGVLTLKPDVLPKDAKSGLPHAVPSHPAIVEWRAMTVIELCFYILFFVIVCIKLISELIGTVSPTLFARNWG